jgi:Glycosyltransferase family 87
VPALGLRHGFRTLRSASGWGIDNWFFTEQRILVCASTVALAYALSLAWRLLNKGSLSGKQWCADFTTWLSGIFASSSDPTRSGFLTAGLVGLSLALVERRPWLSGMFLGFLSYKPQFGIRFLFALLTSHNWRALASAMATSTVLGILAAIVFGYQAWPLFFNSLVHRDPD